jgi:hypothetical protein
LSLDRWRGAKTDLIGQALKAIDGSAWKNGSVKSFAGKTRDELRNDQVFHTRAEAEVLIEQWRRHYNMQRPHSALGDHPPAPEVLLPTPPWLEPG